MLEALLETARDQTVRGAPCVLALILRSDGSTPRGEGSAMLVLADGSIRGSVGGGPTEWAVMAAARELMETGGGTREMSFDLGGTDAVRSDAICGGALDVCLHPVGARDLPALTRVCRARDARERAELVLWREGEDCRLICLAADGCAGAPEREEEIARACRIAAMHPDPRMLYRWSLAPVSRLWLIGGGHVAQATAQVAAVAGFDRVVVDDREEFANETRFPGARCVVCNEAYDDLPAGEIGGDDYIVIVTRGHKADRVALRWALGTRACYVGMIGSRSKCRLIHEALLDEGVPPEQLDRVHAPIGLPIGGRTPGEIAVSIAAQLVQERTRLTREREEAAGT